MPKTNVKATMKTKVITKNKKTGSTKAKKPIPEVSIPEVKANHEADNETHDENKKSTKSKRINKTTSDAKINSIRKEYDTQIESLRDQVNFLKFKLQESSDHLKKSQENYKDGAKNLESQVKELVAKSKKKTKEKHDEALTEYKKYALQGVFQEILRPILLLEQAIENGKNQNDPRIFSYVQGFTMLLEQFFNHLQLRGITKIVPQVGDQFNPEVHEVISTAPGLTKDAILEVKQSGIKLFERVLITAKVVVCV